MENPFDPTSPLGPSDSGMPELPPELKEKLDAVKAVAEKFTKRILKEYKEIKGVALLPPRKQMGLPPVFPVPGQPAQEDDKDAIHLFVLVDDSPIKRKDKLDFIEGVDRNVAKLGKEVDEKIKTTTLTIEELKEQCYDGKYELLRLIAAGLSLHDPADLLAAVRISEVHKSMVIRKFDKYIVSYVAAGSLFRGDKKSNDIDVYVIVDDTDVKRMGRFELKDKLRAIIIGQGYDASRITGVKKQFHIQTYILTDFWESMKDANPVIFTLLRDGVPLYDRGVFMPWKLLLKMGRVKPSPEAIDVQMDIGDKLLVRSRQKLLSVVGEDLYYAMLNPAQAALMMYGLNPPTPAETIQLLRDIFVKKEKLLEEKYVKALEEIRTYYKDIEHGKVKQVTGAEIDRLLKDVEGYLKKLNMIFTRLEKKIDKKNLDSLYEDVQRIVKEVLQEYGIASGTDLKKAFRKFVDEGHVNKEWYDMFVSLLTAKAKELSRSEHQKTRRDSRMFINALTEALQRKRGVKIARNRLRVKYGKKFGDVFLFKDDLFMILDVEGKDKEVKKAHVKDGMLGGMQESTLLELEDYLAQHPAPENQSVKETLLEDLKGVFGKNMEIIL